MAFKKGKERTGGRQRGTPNKATTKAREAIAAFIEGNMHRLAKWLDAIEEASPKQAFDAFMALLEYHVPKLARTEMDAKYSGETEHTYRKLTPEEEKILHEELIKYAQKFLPAPVIETPKEQKNE